MVLSGADTEDLLLRKGRITVFSEAALFGTETLGRNSVGMCRPDACNILQLLLNTMDWLDGVQKRSIPNSPGRACAHGRSDRVGKYERIIPVSRVPRCLRL